MQQVNLFRQRMYDPYWSVKDCAKTFKKSKKAVEEDFSKRNVLFLSPQHGSPIASTEMAFSIDVRMLERIEKMRLVSRFTHFLEEEDAPLECLLQEAAEEMPLFANYGGMEVQLAAAYRAAQFEYARAASIGLGLCDRDGIIAVAHGFSMSPDILLAIANDYASISGLNATSEGYDAPIPLLEIDEFQRFMFILGYMQRQRNGNFYPEHESETEYSIKSLDGMLRQQAESTATE